MVFGGSGSRELPTKGQEVNLRRVLLMSVETLPPDEEYEAHHGMCTGFDALFHLLIREMLPKAKIHGHPAIVPARMQGVPNEAVDVLYPRKEPLVRNHDIVDWVVMKGGIMFAGPKELTEVLRSGTWATIRYARKRGIEPVMIGHHH